MVKQLLNSSTCNFFLKCCGYLSLDENHAAGPSFTNCLIIFTKGWFVPRLIEIGLLILEKISCNINTCTYSFPNCGRSLPQGSWFEQTWIYIISLSFHINMRSSGSVVLEKKILNDPIPFLWLSPSEQDLALYLFNFEFLLPKDNLYHVWLKFACWFWRRILFFNINTRKYGFPIVAPPDPCGPWFERNWPWFERK
jgi:hypothetical protein